MIEQIGEKYTPEQARGLNPLVLAYIGDSVYDLFIRTHIARRGKAGRLHQLSAGVVCARSQAQAAKKLAQSFTPEETEVFLRGRNAKTATVPKNMETADYHMATGLEAVVGYLYLTGQDARMRGMMDTVISEGDL